MLSPAQVAHYGKSTLGLLLLLAGLVGFILLHNAPPGDRSVSTKVPAMVESNDASQPNKTNQAARESISEAYGKLPLSFEANHGQTDPRVKFISRGQGYGLFLTSTGAVLALRNDENQQSAVLRMKLRGANSEPEVAGQEELPGKSNYFIGNDPQNWQTNIPNYKRAHYSSVYEGVDLVYYGNQRQLEYDFIVAPGADPSQIRLSFEGASRVRIDEQGDLLLRTAGGEVRQHKPIVYQEVEGERRELAGSYVRRGRYEVGFEVSDYDQSRPLVIDPVLVYSTYLGGSSTDLGFGITVDADGNAYVTGTTNSLDFPVTAGAFQPAPKLLPGTDIYYGDAFVSKLNQTGTALLYSTYLGGGRAGDSGVGIGVDAAGNAYVTGVTSCSPCVNDGGTNDFPIVNAAQPNYGGTDDAFIAKLNSTGSALIFSTYFGGNSSENSPRIAVNPANGDAYVVGTTSSGNFPTTPGAFKQSQCPGQVPSCSYFSSDAWDAKFNASGQVVWATLLGHGSASDVALDSSGNTYVTGGVGSQFPTTPGAFQTVAAGPVVYVTKVNPTGTGLVYSTYFGDGPQSIRSWGIDIDSAGNAYITGQTQQPALPTTPGAYDRSFNGREDAYVAKFNATGSALLYSTFFGGSLEDIGRSIAVDSSGQAHVTGQTKSTDFPYVNSLQNPVGTPAIYLLKLNSAGSALVYSTNLGTEEGRDVVLDGAGNAYLTGIATSIPFTPGAFQTRSNGGATSSAKDAFVMKIGAANESAQTFSIEGTVFDQNPYDPTNFGPVTVLLTGTQNRGMTIFGGGSFKFGQLPAGGTYTVSVSKAGFAIEPPSQTFTNLGANQTANFTILLNEKPAVDITSPTFSDTFTSPGPVTVNATASDADGTISRVDFTASSSGTNSVIFTGSDSTPPYSVTINNVPAGTLTINAVAVDNLGRPGDSDFVHVQVNCGAGPTVQLTSPAEGTTRRAGEYFTVSASATAGCSSSISYVDFFSGTDRIARKSSAPYSFEWRSLVPGTFTLTAQAVDVAGHSSTSSPVNVNITEANPSIYGRVTDGGNGVSGVIVALTGTRSANTITDASGNYSFTDLNLPPDGNYTVTPSKAGYTFNPASKDISYLGFYDYRVDFDADLITPVSAQITSPSGYQVYTAPANINIQATASSTAGAITKLDFYASPTSGGEPVLIGTDTTAPYTMDWNNVPPGYYTVYVIATDITGATGQDNVFLQVQAAPNTLQISGQVRRTDGLPFQSVRVTLNDGSQTISAFTNINGYYAFFNLPVGGNYTVTPPPMYTFTPSSYTFTNLTTNEADANFTTTQSNTAPAVQMTSPPAGATFTMPAEITVSADATDNDRVVSVTFRAQKEGDIQIVSIGTDTLPPYSIVWGVTSPGTYNVYAVAFDNGGLQTASAPVTITVNPPPPATISGRVVDRNSVGIPLVLMTLSGGQSATTLTDTNGFYSFSNLPTFNDYTVTPAKLNYTFAPSQRTFQQLTASVTADFTATLVLQPSDFDGDGKTDVAVWRPSEGRWYVNQTSNGSIVEHDLGSQSHGDIATPGNYDGDLHTDFAVFRPEGGLWLIYQSSTNSIRTQQWGLSTDKPVAGDYDGDGRTDVAVFRPTEGSQQGLWYILLSSTGGMRANQWGSSTDLPVPGDYDGDGKTDLAVFHPSDGRWWVQLSTTQSVHVDQWGASTDKPVPGDYDGDDKTDLAVFRPSEGKWYIYQSSNQGWRVQQWGLSTDKPVPGDYDLDGKTDLGVFRPSDGRWYILRSTDGGLMVQQWGLSGDVPVPSAYLPQ